jgi:hypothetical protein
MAVPDGAGGTVVDEILTMAEIEARFPSEWVLLDEPQTNEAAILGGRVVYHHPDRDAFDRKVAGIRLKRFAVVYTGKKPADMEYVL